MEYIFGEGVTENDFDIMVLPNLISNESSYLIECCSRYKKHIKNGNHDIKMKEKLQNIINLYVSDETLFPDAISSMCDSISKSDDLDIIDYIIKSDTLYITLNDIIRHLDYDNMKTDNILEIINIITNNSSYCYVCMVVLIFKYLEKPDAFEIINIDDFYKKIKHTLAGCIDVIISSLINEINELNDFDISTMSVYSYISNLYQFIYKCFDDFTSTPELIDNTYLRSKTCNIKWFDKTLPDKIYNFKTKLFYIMLYANHTLFTPLLLLKKGFEKKKGDLQKDSQQYIQSSLTYNINVLDKVYNTIKKYQDLINSINLVILNKNTIKYTDAIYEYASEIIIDSELKDYIWDDILLDIYDIYSDELKIVPNNNVIKLMSLIVDSKDYTANPHIRCMYIKYILDYYNYFNKTQLIHNIINFYNDMGLIKTDDIKIEKLNCFLQIYKYLLTHCLSDSNSFVQFENILLNDEFKFKSFLNFILSDVHTLSGYMYKLIDTYIEVDDDYQLQLDTATIMRLMCYCSETLIILNKFIERSESIKKTMINDEILIMLKSVLMNIVNKYILLDEDDEKQQKLLEIRKYTLIPIDFSDVCKNIVQFILSYDDNDKFIQNIFGETDEFDIKHFIKFVELIKETHTDLYGDIIKLSDKIDDIIKQKSDDTDNYPDEFLDELVFTPLENPVMLPRTKQIVNRETILQYIMTDKTNPFDREELTVDLLDSYNNQEDIRSVIDEKKNKFTTWKENNKKTRLD